jgi:hypothetical protein
VRFARDNKRSAVNLTLDLTVDLYQPLRRYTPNNLQPLGDNRSSLL